MSKPEETEEQAQTRILKNMNENVRTTDFPKPRAARICKELFADWTSFDRTLHICGCKEYHGDAHRCFCGFCWNANEKLTVCPAWQAKAIASGAGGDPEPMQGIMQLLTNERKIQIED